MEKIEALNRIADELKFGLDISPEERTQNIINAFDMVYGLGFDDGRKSIRGNYKRKVIQLNLIGQPIKLYDSVTLAAHAVGVQKSGISKAARGVVETAGGFKWKYSDI